MTIGLQELIALLIVAAVVVAVIFRRVRARRRNKTANEASVNADEIGRRR